MENIYWIQEWARVRQAEVVWLPEAIDVHECFLSNMSKPELEAAFKEIWNMYIRIYGDVAEQPEAFGMPLYKPEEYNSFTVQARESRGAAYAPFRLLFNLLITGSFYNEDFIVDVPSFKAINKVKNLPILFERLRDYGFFFEGLKNYKLSGQSLMILYPDNANVLQLLKLMADKSNKTGRLNDFYCCHYKLLQEDMSTASYGMGADIVADKMHTREEQDFIYELDTVLKDMGYFAKEKSWNEGPGYAYYDKESVMNSNGPYHYWMLSWKTKLILYLRIRNASNCLEYLKQCPDTVKRIFTEGDQGCSKHVEGTCQFGQEYTIDGVTYWKCGCCNAPFYFSPVKEDIPHYIKLVELGLKK